MFPQFPPSCLHPIPLSLYMHVPWCVKKCPYCDFNSHESPDIRLDAQLQTRYFQQLKADLSTQHQYVAERTLQSIFVGGGTPSLVDANHYAQFFDWLSGQMTFAAQMEVTLEANPGTLEHEPFTHYLSAGINRLSIGVQSFNAHHLQALGRIHCADEALQAIERARLAGFERVNVDLMHGLESQTVSQAVQDLALAINSGATHISWYQLTIEPNTVFAKNPPKLPHDDRLDDIQQAGEAFLRSQGFIQYEVSAWRREQPSWHNMNYWTFGDYLAIGAGAHGKVTVMPSAAAEAQIFRFHKTRLPADYLAKTPPISVNIQAIEPEELIFEFMLNALRLKQVVTREWFEQRTFLPWQRVIDQLEKQHVQHLIKWDSEQLHCTDMGYRFLNDAIHVFL